MGKYGNVATGIIDAARQAERTLPNELDASLKKISDLLDKGESADSILKSLTNKNDLAALYRISKASNLIQTGTSEAEAYAKQAQKLLKNDKDIVDATGESLGAVGDARKSADSFFKRNEKTLLAVGLGAAGIAALMLLTGKRDPAAALGVEAGTAAGGLGAALGTGLKAAGDSSGVSDVFAGIGDFFSTYGLYIGIACFILLMLGVFMMLK
jgi:hypothetical protein